MFKKKLCYFFLLLSLVIVMNACSPSKKTENLVNKTSEKSIVIGVTNAPGSFNPLKYDDNTSRHISSILFLPFVELNDQLEWIPMLAEEISTKDNQVYTIKLNKGAKWSDGKPLTIDDVIFTASLMGQKYITYSYSKNLALIEGFNDEGKLPSMESEIPGMKRIDDHTVEFHLKNPIDPNLFNQNFGRYFKTLPKHVLENEDLKSFDQSKFLREPSISSGTFTFFSYKKDQYVELAANKNYFKGSPKIDKLFFKIMNAANITSQLENGDIDMNFPGIGNIPIEDFERVKDFQHVRTISGLPFSYQVLTFNVDVIQDQKVRQAILHSINRKLIAESLYKGEADIRDGLYTSIHPYSNDKLKPIEYNPEKAKQLLKDAGWNFDKTLRFVVPSGNSTQERAADIIVQNLKEVGVKAQIEKYDISTTMQKYSDHDFDLHLVGFQFDLDPDLSPYLKTGAIYNASGYSNPEMDQLLDSGLTQFNPDNRRPIYDEVQKILTRDMPVTQLYATLELGAVSKNVAKGVPKSIGMLIDVHEWDIKN
jgi:peptide/nickel transport system substrate-binding protein